MRGCAADGEGSGQVDGIRDDKSGNIFGNIEAKYLLPKYGLTVTPAWSTSNLVRSTFELDNQIAKGPSRTITRPDDDGPSCRWH